MNNARSLSIIALTKNRAGLLELCLISLKGQLQPTDEVIIIDNNSTDNTQYIIRKYKPTLPIRAYKSGLSGYPDLYNLAISKCTKPLIVFLDDDCEAAPGFISRIRKRYHTKQNFVLQGKTFSLPRNNIFSEISEDHLANWMNSNVVGKNRLRVIDNRNVTIPKAIIKEVGGFSTKMKIGSEDVELGIRLFHLGIPIVYDSSIVVYHNERTTLKEFLIQHYRIAKSHAVLDNIRSERQNISIVNKHTLARHLLSALKRQCTYLYKRRYRDAFFLPLVYLLLAFTRIVGYLSERHE